MGFPRGAGGLGVCLELRCGSGLSDKLADITYDWTIMRTRSLAAIVSPLLIALPLGCDPYECPPGWTDGETNPRCMPPNSHVQEVKERVETGFYGYANERIYVSTDAYEMVECEVGDLARETEFTVGVFDPATEQWQASLVIKTDGDGLFEFAADSTLEYSFDAAPGLGRWTVDEGLVQLLALQIGGGDCEGTYN